MDPRRRQELTRYGAPAAFLAAVTIAVILIKAGLNSSGATTTVGALPTTQTATKPAPTTTRLVLTTPPATNTTATTTTTTTTTTSTSTSTSTSPTTSTATTTPGAAYYAVQSGDTLGSIAQKYNTTVNSLMTLNPGIDPAALHIGQKIRVK
jgi:LysM repeat protein